jgi:hypothetical protein
MRQLRGAEMLQGKLSEGNRPIMEIGVEQSVPVRSDFTVRSVREQLDGERPPNFAVVMEDGKPRAVVRQDELEGKPDDLSLGEFIWSRPPCPNPVMVYQSDPVSAVVRFYVNAVEEWRERHPEDQIKPDIVVTGEDRRTYVVPSEKFTDYATKVFSEIEARTKR